MTENFTLSPSHKHNTLMCYLCKWHNMNSCTPVSTPMEPGLLLTKKDCPMLCFTSISFVPWTYLFFSCNYSSTPHHWPADSTCLCNHFLPSTSLDPYESFSLTHIYFFMIPLPLNKKDPSQLSKSYLLSCINSTFPKCGRSITCFMLPFLYPTGRTLSTARTSQLYSPI